MLGHSPARHRILPAATRVLLVAAIPAIAIAGCRRSEQGPAPTPAQATPGSDAVTPQPSNRIVVKTNRDVTPQEVGAELRRMLDTDVRVEPLFRDVRAENDPEQLRRFFLVSYSPQARLASAHPWDAAYATRRSELIAESAPDQQHVLADATMRSSLAGLCFGTVGNPPKDWALVMIHARQAWDIPPARQARGIRICHPDTGWAKHEDVDRDRLDLASSLDLIDGTPDAQDPLDYSGGLLTPGHGTGTASVIVSGGGIANGGTTPPGEVTGVAPEATLIPIRTAKSVVQVFDSDLARSVQHATRVGGNVISMSLGGEIFFGLHAAIRDAVQKGLLVLSAAGNCVGFVVAPAVYPEVIAVAAVNERSEPWKGTSKGSAVAISAPGEDVWHAVRAPGDGGKTKVVRPGHGTSYAVAMTAGAAALWLDAYRTSRNSTTPQPNLQEVLRADLRASATVPAGWDSHDMGAGILNAEGLLQRAVATQAFRAAPSSIPAKPTVLELLARLVGADPKVVQRNVAELLGKPPESIPQFLETYGHELMAIVMKDPQGLVPVLAKPTVESTPRLQALRTPVLAQASQTFREAVKR